MFLDSTMSNFKNEDIDAPSIRRVSEPNKLSLDDSDRSLSEDDDSRYNNTTALKHEVGRKRIMIDESKLDGEELRKLETRREYNRRCAARARKRSKDLVSTLQKQVDELAKDKAELKRTNDVMKAQLELLEQQNRTLLMSQMAGQMISVPMQGRMNGGNGGGGYGGNNVGQGYMGMSSLQGHRDNNSGFNWRGLH